jgi:hypothetical protein
VPSILIFEQFIFYTLRESLVRYQLCSIGNQLCSIGNQLCSVFIRKLRAKCSVSTVSKQQWDIESSCFVRAAQLRGKLRGKLRDKLRDFVRAVELRAQLSLYQLSLYQLCARPQLSLYQLSLYQLSARTQFSSSYSRRELSSRGQLCPRDFVRAAKQYKLRAYQQRCG